MKPTRGFVVLAVAWVAGGAGGSLAAGNSTDEDIQRKVLQTSQDTDATGAEDSSSTNLRWQDMRDEERADQFGHNVTFEDADVPIQTPFSPNSSEENDTSVPRLFPLTRSDYVGFACAAIGLMIAAGGGIGGGGILVPIWLLLVKLPVKYAISTTSVTILGGGIANVLLNSFKRHPIHKDRSSVDWVLTLLVEPTQMGGTLVGTLLHDFLPDLLVVVLLLALLSLTAFRTIDKANQLHAKETRTMAQVVPEVRRGATGTADPESQRLVSGAGTKPGGPTAYRSVELSKESTSSLEHDTNRRVLGYRRNCEVDDTFRCDNCSESSQREQQQIVLRRLAVLDYPSDHAAGYRVFRCVGTGDDPLSPPSRKGNSF
jgi:Sulfite exporter TauE/SafE